MADGDTPTQQTNLAVKVLREQNDRLKETSALTIQALENTTAQEQAEVEIKGRRAANQPDNENAESVRDVYARHLARHPESRGYLTNGISPFEEKDGMLALASSAKEYSLKTCVTTFPDNNTIHCGRGWGKCHLEAMVDTAKEKGWEAVVITDKTSKFARQQLLEICERKGIPVVDKSVKATFDNDDDKPRVKQ